MYPAATTKASTLAIAQTLKTTHDVHTTTGDGTDVHSTVAAWALRHGASMLRHSDVCATGGRKVLNAKRAIAMQ